MRCSSLKAAPARSVAGLIPVVVIGILTTPPVLLCAAFFVYTVTTASVPAPEKMRFVFADKLLMWRSFCEPALMFKYDSP